MNATLPKKEKRVRAERLHRSAEISAVSRSSGPLVIGAPVIHPYFSYTPAASLVVIYAPAPVPFCTPYPLIPGPLGSFSIVAGARVPLEQPPVFVKTIIDGRSLTALIDSRSAVSCITPSLAHSLARKGRCTVRPDKLAVTSYDGETKNLSKQTDLSLRFNTIVFS